VLERLHGPLDADVEKGAAHHEPQGLEAGFFHHQELVNGEIAGKKPGRAAGLATHLLQAPLRLLGDPPNFRDIFTHPKLLHGQVPLSSPGDLQPETTEENAKARKSSEENAKARKGESVKRTGR